MQWNNSGKEESKNFKNAIERDKQTIKELKAHASLLSNNLALLNERCSDSIKNFQNQKKGFVGRQKQNPDSEVDQLIDLLLLEQ